jgi:hypothetical protein
MAGIARAARSIQSGVRAHATLYQLASEIARLHPDLRHSIGGSLRQWQDAVRAATGLAETAGDAPLHGLMPPPLDEDKRRRIVSEQLGERRGAAPPEERPEPNTSLSLDAALAGRIVAKGKGAIPLSVDSATFREAEEFLRELDNPGAAARQQAQARHAEAVALSLSEVQAPFRGATGMRILSHVDPRRHAEVLAELAAGREGVYLSNVAYGPVAAAPRRAVFAAPADASPAPRRSCPRIDIDRADEPVDVNGSRVLQDALDRADREDEDRRDLDDNERAEQASLLAMLVEHARKATGLARQEAMELLHRIATPSAYGDSGGPRELLARLRQAMSGHRPASEQGASSAEQTAKGRPFVA